MSDIRRETLLDFFYDFANVHGDSLIYDNGYRTRTHTYTEIARAAEFFASRLRDANAKKGDKVIIWSENRPEWVVAFWGCLLIGAVVVPIDYRASSDFLHRVRKIVQARIILVGDEISLPSFENSILVWRLADLGRPVEPSPDVPDNGPDYASKSLIRRDDVAEIIFTSGATAEPKGVVITHRNLLANLIPIEREVAKYRRYLRPFLPLRFLTLPPLSHLFAQAMAVFIIPMLPGTVVFMRGYNPQEIVRQVRKRRVSVVVCVPKILDMLRGYVVRLEPKTAEGHDRKRHIVLRWFEHWKIHRLFGLKFWCFIVGAAPLDPELEEFWSGLGFLVVQGYGLTETAPIVTFNQPFDMHKGSVGKVMPGTEIKIAPDGEILVRGESVTPGYFQAEAETAQVFEDGWLHTGDIGGFDEQGRLYIRGRKKEMIVTPEGLNVFPEDVERVLDSIPGVRESAVVGVTIEGKERVHAVIVPELIDPRGKPVIDPNEVMRQANTRLADHQKIRALTVWPSDKLPRTEGTQKLRRREIKDWVEEGKLPHGVATVGDSIESIIMKFTGGQPARPDMAIEELGLSSLERLELLMELEERFQTSIDESAFARARNVEDLRAIVERPSSELPAEPIDLPSWSRYRIVHLLRRLNLAAWILPFCRLFTWIHVEGREHLQSLERPVIFAANHQSVMDAPAILAALPSRWRYTIAPAIYKEYFNAYFLPGQYPGWQWLIKGIEYYLVTFFFNTFPLPQREAGARQVLRYIGELVDEGFSILIFPEGERTEHGEIKPFQAGVGMIASRLALPVVPVYLEGMDRVLHHTWWIPRPGRVRVVFGPPLRLEGDDYQALARRVEEAVKQLG